MKKISLARKALRFGGVLLAVQVVWWAGMQAVVDRTHVRTVATVVRMDRIESRCAGDGFGRQDRTCDRSDRLIPVYEFSDETGKRHEKPDTYMGEFKENNPLRRIFGKDPGDRVTVYYEPGRPDQALFMASTFSYAPWLVPLFLAPLALVVWGLVLTWRERRPEQTDHQA